MSQIRVIVVSPEEAYDGTAGFWCGGELMGVTMLSSGGPHTRIAGGDHPRLRAGRTGQGDRYLSGLQRDRSGGSGRSDARARAPAFSAAS
jgi:hypothetical protein